MNPESDCAKLREALRLIQGLSEWAEAGDDGDEKLGASDHAELLLFKLRAINTAAREALDGPKIPG